jgi:putative transposase
MSFYSENRHAHSVGWSTWHFEWCTKYWYNVFTRNRLKSFCKTALTESAIRYKIKVIEIEVDVDHMHVIVSLSMTLAPTTALNFLKGMSARIIFQLVPNLPKRYPRGHLWSPGKFAASIGPITLEGAKKYLEDHHAKMI